MVSSNDQMPASPARSAGNAAGKPANGLHTLHEVALKLAALGRGRSTAKTRELMAMLLGHGARAWRLSQPRVRMHLHVLSPEGRFPVRLRLR